MSGYWTADLRHGRRLASKWRREHITPLLLVPLVRRYPLIQSTSLASTKHKPFWQTTMPSLLVFVVGRNIQAGSVVMASSNRKDVSPVQHGGMRDQHQIAWTTFGTWITRCAATTRSRQTGGIGALPGTRGLPSTVEQGGERARHFSTRTSWAGRISLCTMAGGMSGVQILPIRWNQENQRVDMGPCVRHPQHAGGDNGPSGRDRRCIHRER
jgi:hypothetical protein